jgi:hypothetical protein
MSQPLRYAVPPPEHKRVLGSFTAAQLTTLGVVAVVAVFGVAAGTTPTPAGMLLAVALIGLAAVVVLAPLGGRTLTEWAPLTLRYELRRLRGLTDVRARVSLHGRPGDRLRLPAELGDLEILAHPWQERVLGVVVDRAAGLYSAALEVHGPQFLLETTSRQEQLLGRWGAVLARLAGPGQVHRL